MVPKGRGRDPSTILTVSESGVAIKMDKSSLTLSLGSSIAEKEDNSPRMYSCFSSQESKETVRIHQHLNFFFFQRAEYVKGWE